MSVETPPVTPPTKILSALEWTVSILLFVACVVLNYTFLTQGGGFWRDEANSIQLALIPGIRENWNLVWLDAHPVGYSLFLKPFVLGGKASVSWLRWVGFFTCLTVFGAFWTAAWRLTKRPPLFFFALLVLNHYVIRYTASLRPYGVVTLLLLLLVFACYLRTQKPNSRWPWHVTLLCVAIVNVNYAAIVPAFIIALGATVITFRSGGMKAALALGGAAALGFASLAFYLPALSRAQVWVQMTNHPQRTFGPAQGAFLESLETDGTIARYIWLFLLVATPILALTLIFRSGPWRNRGLWLLVSWIVVPAVITVLYLGRTLTAPWYFVPAFFILGLGLEIALGAIGNRRVFVRWGLLAASCLVFANIFFKEIDYLKLRQTNMDLMAARITKEATSKDLVIVVNPFQGVSFDLYYAGKAPWYTVPPVTDHRLHRLDLIIADIGNPAAMTPLYTKIEKTLSSGGKLFLVGAIRYDPRPMGAASMPLDRPLHGWSNDLAQFLGQHYNGARQYQVEGDTQMFPYELPPLVVVEGWH